jgi:alanine racemase
MAGLEVPILSWLNPSGIDAELALDQRIDIAIGSVDELGALCPDPPIHRYYAAPDRRAGGVDNARQASSLPSTLSPCHRTCPVPLATRAIGGSGLGPWQPGQGPVRVHLYLDTGMAREGCQAREWTTLVAQALRAQQRGQITVVGIMGHIPAAQFANPEAHSSAAALIRQANQAASRAGLSIRLTHLAATASALNDPTTHFDLVRVGAGLVGIDPAGLTNLHAACHLRAPVVHTSFVPAGTPVGYGGSYVTPVATNLAVLPVGYADGIPRELSGDAYVEINRRPARIVGRVSMDQIVVDTRSQRVPYATIATVFGPPDGITPTIHDWARWANTIPHTIITGIGSRVRRRHP